MVEKPSIVVLPGWGGSHETWANFLALAEKYFTVYCIDLPCFGGVPCPAEVWGVEEYAAYVEKKISQLPIPKGTSKKPILLGHSFGGQVALKVVVDYPELCSGLVLSAAAVIRPFRPWSRAFFYVVAKVGALVFRLPVVEKASVWAKKILYRAARSPDYTATSTVQREIFKKIIRQDLQNILPQVSLPTLVLWGTSDSYLPVRDAERITRSIPGAESVIFSHGRHGLHIQMPDKMIETITRFVRTRLSV